MALSTQPYKGARDFYPEDMRQHKWLLNKLRETVEKFGYVEYDAPLIEPYELYAAKTGEEILNDQLYSFIDRGERKVAIRPEMTPSVSRMVAGRRQELAYPLRWYSIPNLWRYERPQRGRLREHYQLNVDIFGVEGLEADFEIIQIADAILKSLKAEPNTYEIHLNSRKALDKLLGDQLGLDEKQQLAAMKLIDRHGKLEPDKFKLEASDLLGTKADDLHKYLASGKSDSKKLNDLLAMLKKAGVSSAVYDPRIVRGMDYYTDIVFEVYDNDPENRRSLFGGGRYDGLVGLFGVEPVPTVGFGMGDVTLMNFLEGHKLLPQLKSEVDAVVVLIGDVYKDARPLIEKVRKKANVAVDFSDRKTDKKIQSADKAGVQKVIFIGEDEVKSGTIRVKDLKTGQDEAMKPEDF